jgi:hypothetical protein
MNRMGEMVMLNKSMHVADAGAAPVLPDTCRAVTLPTCIHLGHAQCQSATVLSIAATHIVKHCVRVDRLQLCKPARRQCSHTESSFL